MIAQKKKPQDFINFLLMRESLHEKLMCLDELEVCGAFLSRKLNQQLIDRLDTIANHPHMGDIFDQQYYKGMGFKNEKYLAEKQDGKHLFF